MRITRFQYQDKASNWKTGVIELNGFNLLVGASGVGKTRLLHAVEDLISIAGGMSKIPTVWSMDFITNGKKIHWTGELIPTNNPDSAPEENPLQSVMTFERLDVEQECLIEREREQITYSLHPLPGASQCRSRSEPIGVL